MSWDWFLGAPFNIASYAILALLLQEITGHKAKGILASGLCAHLYENQIEQAKKLSNRSHTKHNNCELVLSDKLKELCANYNGNVDEIFQNMEVSDFSLKGYTSDKPLNAEMIAPLCI